MADYAKLNKKNLLGIIAVLTNRVEMKEYSKFIYYVL